jgi:hypothetical protein
VTETPGQPLPDELLSEIIDGLFDDPTTERALPTDNLSKQAIIDSVTPATITTSETVPVEELNQQIDRDERTDLIKLRRTYAMRLLWLMVAQLVFMNVTLVLSSTHELLHVNSITMRYFLTGTLGEIVGVVTVSARFLFSDKPFLGKH